MDLKQKYTEGTFQLDDFFLNKLREFKSDEAFKIASIIDTLSDLNSPAEELDTVSGFINNRKGNPIFFMIEYYIEEEDGTVVLVDINQIEVDEYLDEINLNKYIK